MTSLQQRLRALTNADLQGMRRGIEKESLRALPGGALALTPHPAALGSALANPNITTDFSESQIEIVTGVHADVEACLEELTQIHQFVYRAIGDEMLWVASMPCGLPPDETIPIGRYGTSNVGRAKSVYRMGLGHRYGRRMQTISGIHYNWSMPGVSNEEYFALIRNFRRHSFLLLYLFGASPAVCSTFVAGRAHELQSLDERHAAHAARHLAAHGAARLPERCAVVARGQLQQPRELRRVAAGRADPALSALRGGRHPQPGRRVQPARDHAAADRERVLRHDPARSA